MPQQPPTILTNPLSANSSKWEDIYSGLSSYPPNAFGNPAFGYTLMWVSAKFETAWICGRKASAPNAQLNPTLNGLAWEIEFQKASGVCPERVRPDASVIVPDKHDWQFD